MPVVKPASIANDPFKSAKWDELTVGRDFAPSDAPTLALLCAWYQVVDKCMSDIDAGGGVQVAYQNDVRGIKALPQLSTMKQESAEIRQLDKQLGIDDEVQPECSPHAWNDAGNAGLVCGVLMEDDKYVRNSRQYRKRMFERGSRGWTANPQLLDLLSRRESEQGYPAVVNA